MNLPREYIGFKFLQLSPYSYYNRDSGKYIGCCPLCREGKSFGKKKRLAYIPEYNVVTCLNCNQSYVPLDWIQKVSGQNYWDVLKDFNDFCSGNIESNIFPEEKKSEIKIPDLPINEIDLFNENQLNYYRNNKNVIRALKFLKDRKLHTAVNRPTKYCISLDDKYHKNRLIIPFFDENNKVLNYQSRCLDSEGIRYLTKINGTSCLFNYNKIDSDYENIFIFEGPFDSTFVRNGIAIGGIQENSYRMFRGIQEDQIKTYPFHNKIWVLDSQHTDTAALKKSVKLLQSNQKVFIWPKKIGTLCKDFNDIAVLGYEKYITPEWIIKNSFTGDEGVLKIKTMLKN